MASAAASGATSNVAFEVPRARTAKRPRGNTAVEVPRAKAAKHQRGNLAFEEQQQQRKLAEPKEAEAELFKEPRRMHRRDETFCTPEEQEGILQDESESDSSGSEDDGTFHAPKDVPSSAAFGIGARDADERP